MIPDQEKLWTNSKTGRRVAIINDALLQIGPPLAIEFAKAGHDLVIAQPQEGLVEKLKGLGSKVVVVEGVEQSILARIPRGERQLGELEVLAGQLAQRPTQQLAGHGLVVLGARIDADDHAADVQRLDVTAAEQQRRVVAGIAVGQRPAGRVENAIKDRDKEVGLRVGQDALVGGEVPRQVRRHLPVFRSRR